MRVVVTGLVATYPVGGVAWDYLQYVQGFAALGCDVVYLEDTGQWFYDPDAATFTPEPRAGAAYLAAALRAADARAGDSAGQCAAPDGRYLGMDEQAVRRACAGADLFLNVSGACWLRDAYREARIAAYIDTDPCYSQAKLAAVDGGVADELISESAALIRRHDVFFTLGEHVGQPDCLVPTVGLTWLPTRQPVVLENWPVTEGPAERFTTVLSWSINPTPPVVGGRIYGGKDVEFERFLDLPQRTDERLEAAISGAAPRERLVAAGWQVIDARTRLRDPRRLSRLPARLARGAVGGEERLRGDAERLVQHAQRHVPRVRAAGSAPGHGVLGASCPSAPGCTRSPAPTRPWPRWRPCGRTMPARARMRARSPSVASVRRTCARV